MNLNAQLKLDDIVGSPNIAEHLDDEDLITIGETVFKEFTNDLQSRSAWEMRMEQCMKLALQEIGRAHV